MLVTGQEWADSEQAATGLVCLEVAVEVLRSFSGVVGLQLRSLVKVTLSKRRMLQRLLQNWPFPAVGHRHAGHVPGASVPPPFASS